MDAEDYRGVSVLLYVAYWFVAFFAGVTGFIFLTELTGAMLSEGWAIAANILGGLAILSTAFALFETLRRRRADGYFALRFPGYAGERFPIFHALTLDGPFGGPLRRDGAIHSLGVGGEAFFLLRNTGHDARKDMIGGTVEYRPGTDEALLLRRDAILAVDVIERSDAEIAGAAVDQRDFGDRLGSLIAQKITGTSVKTKIVPFAAYLVIHHDGPAGPERLVAAVPTEVPSEVLAALGHAIDAGTDTGDAVGKWVAGTATDGAGWAATEGIDMAGTALVGGDAVAVGHDALGAVGSALAWLNPDQAAIGSTAGDRGRAAAQLIAGRIRQLCGLPLEAAPEAQAA